MPSLARVGDMSDHGGFIISGGSTTVETDGQPAALLGAQHSCPIPRHGITPIAPTETNLKNGGLPRIRRGDMAGCGAIILSGSDVYNGGPNPSHVPTGYELVGIIDVVADIVGAAEGGVAPAYLMGGLPGTAGIAARAGLRGTAAGRLDGSAGLRGSVATTRHFTIGISSIGGPDPI